MSKYKAKPIVPFVKGSRVSIAAGTSTTREMGTVVYDSGHDKNVLVAIWSKKKNAYTEHLVSRSRLKLATKPGTPAP